MPREWTPLIERHKKQCANCGLLGQMRLIDRELVPMLAEFRGWPAGAYAHGYLSFLKEQGGGYGGHPICAASERDFRVGYGEVEAYAMDRFKWRDMLALPMDDCPSFIQWVPGLSIRDHKEMLNQAFMAKREDERDAAMSSREDQRDANADWHFRELRRLENERYTQVDAREDARDKAAEDRHHREIRWFGGVIAIATLVAAVIAATATCLSGGNTHATVDAHTAAAALSTPVTPGAR